MSPFGHWMQMGALSIELAEPGWHCTHWKLLTYSPGVQLRSWITVSPNRTEEVPSRKVYVAVKCSVLFPPGALRASVENMRLDLELW